MLGHGGNRKLVELGTSTQEIQQTPHSVAFIDSLNRKTNNFTS